MAPPRKIAPRLDPDSDDDEQSMLLDAGSSYPYFQTADPALAAAYAYGDPTGGHQYPDPVALFGNIDPPSRTSPSQIRYEGENFEEDDDNEDEEDDEDEEIFRHDLALAQATVDANEPRIDPDYDSAVEAGAIDALSDDDFGDSDADTTRSKKGARGRGRRGRSRGGARGTGRSNAPRVGGQVGITGPRGGKPRRRGGARTGPRQHAEPTAEFKDINGLMSSAYIAEDYDEALKLGLKAITINPEMFHVHATIGEILLRKGRKDDALGALYVGVHATRDESSWWYVIEKLLELGGGTKDTLQRLQDCYSSLLDMDPENYKARFGRMKNYMASGQKNRARNECLNLIHRNAFDTEALQVLAEICFSVEEPNIAAPAFKKYFEHHISISQGAPDDPELMWKMLDLYMDLLVHASKWEEALLQLRYLARWILGRPEESFWDKFEDDREWDFDDEPRRVEVQEFIASAHPLEAYGEGLPIELRQKIGLIRLGMGLQYQSEALDHFEYLEPEDDSLEAYVHEYPDLFREIGDALREEQLHQDALRFYEPIQRLAQGIDSRFYFDIAICYQALGRDQEVKATMEALRLFKRGARDHNFYIGLAKLYQSQGKENDMQSIIRQLGRMGKTDVVIAAGLPVERDTMRPAVTQAAQDGDEGHESDPDLNMLRKIRGRSQRVRKDKKHEQAQIREGLVRNLYDQLCAMDDDVANDDPEAIMDWTNLADQLMDEFKSEKLFFPSERAKKFLGYERWQRTVNIPEGDILLRESTESDLEIPVHYCEIHFDEWLDVLLQLALQHARMGQSDDCWEVMKTISSANIFSHEPPRMHKKHNVALACSLLLQDEKQLIEETRWFIKNFAFIPDSYRLFSAMNRFCRGPTTYYNSGPEQKFVLRAIKAMDYALLPQEHRAQFGFTEGDREKWNEAAAGTENNPHGLTEHDPTLLALYGHLMFVAATYASALTYYFRAYVLRPDDPMLNLCIAVAYIQMGYKRQAENRQYQIQQGLSFAMRYYELRTKDNVAIKMQEAEFNIGLIWHTLGLHHLALPCYERCMELSGRVQKERMQAGMKVDGEFVEDLAAEAAFVVQGMLAMGGDFEGARKVTERYLVL